MNEKKILTKIVDGSYDTQISTFVRSYDDIFKWMISRYKNSTLAINIYSCDFVLNWNDNTTVLEPSLYNNIFTVDVNQKILPRYGVTLMQWLKDLHKCSNILLDYVAPDVIKTIISYTL